MKNILLASLLALLFAGCCAGDHQPDHVNFGWLLPDGYEIDEITTNEQGLSVKISRAVSPGPLRPYKIGIVQGTALKRSKTIEYAATPAIIEKYE